MLDVLSQIISNKLYQKEGKKREEDKSAKMKMSYCKFN